MVTRSINDFKQVLVQPGWQLLQDVKLTADSNVIDFTGLAAYGCDMFMLEGMIIPSETATLYPHYQFNGDTGAKYSYIYHGFTGSGIASTNYAPNGGEVAQVQMGPLLSTAETCHFKLRVRAKADVQGLIGFNSVLRPSANDWHNVGGAYHSAAKGDKLNSIHLFSQTPFSSVVYLAGTHFKLSGFF